MFERVKKSGRNQHLQLVENRKEKGKVKQRVITTTGRMDQLKEKGRNETLIRSLSRFSEKAHLVLSGQSDVGVEAKTFNNDVPILAQFTHSSAFVHRGPTLLRFEP